jgi:hypothetical protein
MKRRRVKHQETRYVRRGLRDQKRERGSHRFAWWFATGELAERKRRKVIKLAMSSIYGKFAGPPQGVSDG